MSTLNDLSSCKLMSSESSVGSTDLRKENRSFLRRHFEGLNTVQKICLILLVGGIISFAALSLTAHITGSSLIEKAAVGTGLSLGPVAGAFFVATFYKHGQKRRALEERNARLNDQGYLIR